MGALFWSLDRVIEACDVITMCPWVKDCNLLIAHCEDHFIIFCSRMLIRALCESHASCCISQCQDTNLLVLAISWNRYNYKFGLQEISLDWKPTISIAAVPIVLIFVMFFYLSWYFNHVLIVQVFVYFFPDILENVSLREFGELSNF